MMKKTWGHYKVLAEGKGYKVKILYVKPNGKTSIQRHLHRSEYWIFLGKQEPYETKIIRAGEVHQLANLTNKEIRVIEIQVGDKCIEHDIERITYGKEN